METRGGNREAKEALVDQVASRYRANLAVEYRLKGMDYDTIAKELGFANKSGAWKAVDRTLRRKGQEVASDELELMVAELDRLQERAWPAAMKGNVNAVGTCVNAIRERVGIIDRYGKVLGFDESQRAADAADAYLKAEGAAAVVNRDPARVFESSKVFVFVYLEGGDGDQVVYVEKGSLTVHVDALAAARATPSPRAADTFVEGWWRV